MLIKTVLVISALLSVLVSCSFQASSRRECKDANVTESEKQSIETFDLDPSSQANRFEIGEPITLLVENTTEVSLWFPPDEKIVIYEIDQCGEKIRELSDLMNREFGREIVLTPGGGVDSLGIVGFFPDIEEGTEKIHFDIYVSAFIYEDEMPTDIEIVSHTMVTLTNK